MKPYYGPHAGITIYHGDVRAILPQLEAESVHCVVTSPPYWGLRDYGVSGQLGLEPTPGEYISEMVAVFREVKRVLRSDGTLWLNMGDSYAHGVPGGGSVFDNGRNDGRVSYESDKARGRHKASTLAPGMKPKDLCGIPWMLAFALRADGWYLRSDIIWHKPNPMPESVTDRPTKAHEYLFLLSKSERYHYDAAAIAEESVTIGDNRAERMDNTQTVGRNGSDSRKYTGQPTGETRNKRSVWTVTTSPFPEAHFATFPPDLIKPCILAGCPAGGTVLDPFMGAGTTGLVAAKLHCKAIGVELNAEYCEIAAKRLSQEVFQF